MEITNFRVTINGTRGAGKTTIMRILRQTLKNNELFVTADIVPVKHDHSGETEIYDVQVIRRDCIHKDII